MRKLILASAFAVASSVIQSIETTGDFERLQSPEMKLAAHFIEQARIDADLMRNPDHSLVNGLKNFKSSGDNKRDINILRGRMAGHYLIMSKAYDFV